MCYGVSCSVLHDKLNWRMSSITCVQGLVPLLLNTACDALVGCPGAATLLSAEMPRARPAALWWTPGRLRLAVVQARQTLNAIVWGQFREATCSMDSSDGAARLPWRFPWLPSSPATVLGPEWEGSREPGSSFRVSFRFWSPSSLLVMFWSPTAAVLLCRQISSLQLPLPRLRAPACSTVAEV
jgi:hypothetical protein